MIKKFLIKENNILAQFLFIIAIFGLVKFLLVQIELIKAIYLLIFICCVGFGGLLTTHNKENFSKK